MPLYWAVTRDLQAGEESRFESETLGVKPIPLAKVREIHHQIARLLAQGLRPVEVSAIVGFSQSRISILKSDPTFKELLAFYSNRRDEIGQDLTAKLTALTLDAMTTLHERLVDAPEEITTDELQRAVNAGLDRLGHGSRSTVEVNFITPSTISRLKLAAQEGQVHFRNEEGQEPRKEFDHQTSKTTVIDIAPEDIVSGHKPADPLRRDSSSPKQSQDPKAEGNPPGGTPV
jgi:hypothetical protein